jgi:hypothetical protein
VSEKEQYEKLTPYNYRLEEIKDYDPKTGPHKLDFGLELRDYPLDARICFVDLFAANVIMVRWLNLSKILKNIQLNMGLALFCYGY